MKRCLLLLALVGCQHRDSDVREAVVPPPPQPAVETVAPGEISGRVVETMEASTYTYARLDQGGREIWIAGPKAQLAVGTQLTKLEGQLMTDFHSNTLERTFDKIYFVSGFGPSTAAAAPADDKANVSGTVTKTMDAGGYTYAELDGKTWIAGPTTKLAVGTKLGTMSGTVMTEFHSNTLNRTFDTIYFVPGFETGNAAPATPPHGDAAAGTIVQTMDSGGYTYVELDHGGTKSWIAGPTTKLAVGTKLPTLEGTVMTNFHSKTLDRTFPTITFVTSFPTTIAPAAPAGDAVSGTVVQTMDAGGYTYAELDDAGNKVWVAGPTTKLAVGTKVGKLTGTVMTAFRSNTLNRTFDKILFVGSFAN